MNSFAAAEAIKRNILDLYRSDMNRFSDSNPLQTERVFDTLPAQLSTPTKKFRPSLVRENGRSRDFQNAIAWLADAMIVTLCFRVTEPAVGLKFTEDATSVKLYMADTGLLVSHAFVMRGAVPEELYRQLLRGKLEVNKGMLTENIVGQMLAAAGNRLFYFANSDPRDAVSRMEIDFLIAKAAISNRHNL